MVQFPARRGCRSIALFLHDLVEQSKHRRDCFMSFRIRARCHRTPKEGFSSQRVCRLVASASWRASQARLSVVDAAVSALQHHAVKGTTGGFLPPERSQCGVMSQAAKLRSHVQLSWDCVPSYSQIVWCYQVCSLSGLNRQRHVVLVS
jgi:hypothetical protein